MKKDPDLESIVSAAMADALTGDGSSPEDPNDPRFSEFRKMAEAMKLRHYEAPAHVVDAAKAIMPVNARRTVYARLTGSTMAAAGARSATADSFQLTFEGEGMRTRLMYERSATGWEVAGQAPKGLRVVRNGKRVRCDAEGRFTFAVSKLGDTGLTLHDEEIRIIIPPADQADADDAHFSN